MSAKINIDVGQVIKRQALMDIVKESRIGRDRSPALGGRGPLDWAGEVPWIGRERSPGLGRDWSPALGGKVPAAFNGIAGHII
ncbi:hypothetical protein ACX0G7_10920 [Flavitalea antarctica]